MRFKDRVKAGQKLAQELSKYRGKDVVVYGLPRGGVVLAAEIAKDLGAPLDLVIPRKIGHQFNPEYAICAVTEHGELVCNEAEQAAVNQKWFEAEVKKEQAEAKRRREAYLGGRKQVDVKNKTAIIVDDGIATGLTMQAAIKDIKKRQPAKIVVAVPVSPRDTAQLLEQQVDEVVALDIPAMYLGAVGAYYDEFAQVEDAEVIELLKDAKENS